MHYLLFYEVGEGYVARRAEFREEHLRKAWESSARGELVLGGALAHPVDGAVLLFRGDSPEVAEAFARADPYVTSGAVKRWHVREWTTVAGETAALPIRPAGAAGSEQVPERRPSLARQEPAVMRMWSTRAAAPSQAGYVQHLAEKVFPLLRRIEGHRGAYLLRRAVNGAVEFVVLTIWDSMEAVRRFAGPRPEQAVVDPEAKAALERYDDFATHFEIVNVPEKTSGAP